jgi:hypothetical protein
MNIHDQISSKHLESIIQSIIQSCLEDRVAQDRCFISKFVNKSGGEVIWTATQCGERVLLRVFYTMLPRVRNTFRPLGTETDFQVCG